MAAVLHLRGEQMCAQPAGDADGNVLLWNGEVRTGVVRCSRSVLLASVRLRLRFTARRTANYSCFCLSHPRRERPVTNTSFTALLPQSGKGEREGCTGDW